MASNGYDSFLKFLLFYVLLQKNISISNAEVKCLNPSFGKDQKLVIHYFYDPNGIRASGLCSLVLKSNGLVSMVFHMVKDPKDTANCMESDFCKRTRLLACIYKADPAAYNDCNNPGPDLDSKLADCVCEGSADDILKANQDILTSHNIQTLPVLLFNDDYKYDPCFTDFSQKGIADYLCKAYQKALPFCTV